MKVKVTQSCLTLRPHGLYSPWNSPDQNTGVGSLSLLQGIFPTQRSNRLPALQVDSLPIEPPGKPKNTGVGSLSLLQGIFPTQELNQGLLHCREILYQLSYQGRTLLNRSRVGRERGYWFSSVTSLTISITYHYDTNKHPCWL